jgi:hypothetical protein
MDRSKCHAGAGTQHVLPRAELHRVLVHPCPNRSAPRVATDRNAEGLSMFDLRGCDSTCAPGRWFFRIARACSRSTHKPPAAVPCGPAYLISHANVTPSHAVVATQACTTPETAHAGGALKERPRRALSVWLGLRVACCKGELW